MKILLKFENPKKLYIILILYNINYSLIFLIFSGFI